MCLCDRCACWAEHLRSWGDLLEGHWRCSILDRCGRLDTWGSTVVGLLLKDPRFNEDLRPRWWSIFGSLLLLCWGCLWRFLWLIVPFTDGFNLRGVVWSRRQHNRRIVHSEISQVIFCRSIHLFHNPANLLIYRMTATNRFVQNCIVSCGGIWLSVSWLVRHWLLVSLGTHRGLPLVFFDLLHLSRLDLYSSVLCHLVKCSGNSLIILSRRRTPSLFLHLLSSFSWLWSCLSWVVLHAPFEDLLCLHFISIGLEIRLDSPSLLNAISALADQIWALHLRSTHDWYLIVSCDACCFLIRQLLRLGDFGELRSVFSWGLLRSCSCYSWC